MTNALPLHWYQKNLTGLFAQMVSVYFAMFLQQMFMLRTGAAIPSVSDTDLADARIYIPEKSMVMQRQNAVNACLAGKIG